MVDQVDALERMVAAMLAAEQNPTSGYIRDTIESLRESPIASGVSDEAAEYLARRFEERVSITQHIGSVLTEHDFRPWLDAARPRSTRSTGGDTGNTSHSRASPGV